MPTPAASEVTVCNAADAEENLARSDNDDDECLSEDNCESDKSAQESEDDDAHAEQLVEVAETRNEEQKTGLNEVEETATHENRVEVDKSEEVAEEVRRSIAAISFRRERRMAARQSSLQVIAIVLVDKFNRAYRIGLIFLLVLLAFVCGIQCYAQFIVPVPPTADELDTLAPETLTKPNETRYEVTAVGVVGSIILGSIGLISLARAAMVVRKLCISDETKLSIVRSELAEENQACNQDIAERSLIQRVALTAVASKKKVELTGRLFWHGFFTLEALDTVLQIIRLVELGGRSFTGERVIVADRTAIMTQATLIMLVFVVGPTTLILNNRVWAALFDTIVAFSFTAAYLIISGRIFLPDTWPDLRFETFVSFLSSLVPAILSLDNVIGVDRYLYEIAKNPELTRGRKRTCLRSRIIVFISWTIGISGFVCVAITQFKGNCNELIPNFDSECLVPVYPILDSQSCDCRMAFVYLDAPCVEEDMIRVLFYNRLQYLSISDRNTAPSTSCNNQEEALFNAVSRLSELVVLNLVAVPIESLSIEALTKMEVMAATATPLAIVPDDVHLRLPSIRSFQFELSQIQELPFDSLRQMRYLEYIGLAGSPICSGVDFPEWTDGIIDCGLGYDETCVVDESLSKLSQTSTGYCRKWISSGAPTICLPSCDITHETLVSTDVDGSNTLSVQENTAILQSFGLVPQGTEMSAAFHQCVMRSCGKEPSDELAFDVASVIFLLGKTNCEECDS